MSFQEKSTLAMTVILTLVFGWYFVLVLGSIADTPARDIAYTGLMVGVIATLTVLAIVSHVVLAIADREQLDDADERDRLVGWRAGNVGGYVLAVGVFAGIGLAMVRADQFWIAQVLIAGLVLAEIVEGVTKLILYRRGG